MINMGILKLLGDKSGNMLFTDLDNNSGCYFKADNTIFHSHNLAENTAGSNHTVTFFD